MVEFKSGNLLEADVEALVNTVNTAGVMGKGIALQVEPENAVVPWAREWAEVRGASPLFGYPTLEEAVKTLTDFLGSGKPGPKGKK